MTISFPDEIWRHIFSHFEVVLEDDYRDLEPLDTLTALSLVNRRFYLIAQGFLYRTLLLWGLNDFYFGDRRELHVLLATTLASNPRLGMFTREISLAHGNLEDGDEPMKSIRNFVPSLNMSQVFKDWLNREFIFGRKGSGIASFLLALMPRVQLVELRFYKEPTTTLPWILGGWSDGSMGESTNEHGRPHTVSNYLHDLQELRVEAGFGQTCIYITYFETILLHPNLRTLKLSGFDWTEPRIIDMRWQGYPSNLRQVNLDKCIVDASTVRDVLSRCKGLEVLTITAGSFDLVPHLRPRVWEIDLYEFGDVLRGLGQKLVMFELDTYEYRYNGVPRGKIGSLDNLKALRYLSISRNDFIGPEDDSGAINGFHLAEVLPTSIEVMDFREDMSEQALGQNEYEYGRLHDDIYSVLVCGRFPSLRKLELTRLGIPRRDAFNMEVPGWTIKDGAWFLDVSPDYELFTHMELTMERKHDDPGSIDTI
ncbi:hypothetical protein CEP54_003752 [Fusarium duplospermum]|uniref:Uncharacterized protein n=1 Tax=Fusarium duplospermum TaxID=1325734 RepID=A0A428QMT7_9HYPO|nr:hypothetical protein CEP54_003752 [Fusarium duplospermum]